jgi:multidrug efflux system membrane fusion protein
VKTLQNVVTVPTSAIQRGAPGAYVYVINPDNTVAVRPVSTGPIDGNITAINSGLAAGDRVVIDGTDRLREGLKVTVAAEQPASPGGTAGSAGGGQQGGNRGGAGRAQKSDGAKSDGSQSPPSGGQ